MQDKLVYTLLWKVIAGKYVKKLVCHPGFRVQTFDSETGKVAYTQGSLYLVFNLIYYPRCGCCDDIFTIDIESYSQWFSFGRIVVNFLFYVSVNV